MGKFQVTLKEVIHCEDELTTNDDFPVLDSNGEYIYITC